LILLTEEMKLAHGKFNPTRTTGKRPQIRDRSYRTWQLSHKRNCNCGIGSCRERWNSPCGRAPCRSRNLGIPRTIGFLR